MPLTHTQPLATRFRPKRLADVVGQSHLIGPGKFLTVMVESGRMQNLVLYGPPGAGKTSIANALAGEYGVAFAAFNAGTDTKKDLADIAKDATVDAPVIVLLDEIHRLDKTKQDFLLKQLEEGSLILVGATTDNPYIGMNPALRSRSTILQVEPVTQDAIVVRLRDALTHPDALGDARAEMTDEQLAFIASRTNGDLRNALNMLEMVVMATQEDTNGVRHVDDAMLETVMQTRMLEGDKDGDGHYNLLSAFQKSIRGSDVDASLHYLARLLEIGDLVSIHRRMRVIAYEDIGLADAALVARIQTAVDASEKIGLPESRIILGMAVMELALSAKSNTAYVAIDNAIDALRGGRDMSIPRHLRDAHYKGAKALGHGVDYQYPHDAPHNILSQQYLPDDYARDRYVRFRDDLDTRHIAKVYHQINQILGRP